MKISDKFKLKKTQFELDFVDIDTDKDTPLFLDPYFISKCEFPIACDAHSTIRSFFEYLLALLQGNHISEAEEIFSHLGETNDIVWACLVINLRVMVWVRRIQKQFLRNYYKVELLNQALWKI